MKLEKMFNPKTVAVIGASRSPKKVGHIIFKNLLQAKKKVYPINPKAKKILGKKTYSCITEIKEKIDLAIIAVPAKIVPKVMKELVKKKVPYTIIVSAGFSEVGNEKLQREILEIADGKTKILGPNCLGIINTDNKINATFFSELPEKGQISFISQSGALGVAILDWAIKKKMGLSKFISIGNAADIDVPELTEYLSKDNNTKVITMYLESLKNGKKFLEVVKKSKKPVIVLKAGRTKSGKEAAKTHTAAMATDDRIYDGLFEEAGIIRVDTIYQLFEIAQSYAKKQVPKGKNGLIITNAGGIGVVASDAFERAGLRIIGLPIEIKKKLNKILPTHWSKNNPIDIIGDATPERYNKVLKLFEKETFFDFIFLILTPQSMTEPEKVAKIVVKFNKKTKFPIYTCFMGGNEVESAKKILRKNKVLNFEEPEYGAQVINKMIKNDELN